MPTVPDHIKEVLDAELTRNVGCRRRFSRVGEGLGSGTSTLKYLKYQGESLNKRFGS